MSWYVERDNHGISRRIMGSMDGFKGFVLQEKPIFQRKIDGFLYVFPVNQSIDGMIIGSNTLHQDAPG